MKAKVDPAVLQGALGWIVANLKEFNPFNERGLFERKRGKRFIELAIATCCYAQLTNDFRSEEIHRIVIFLDSVLTRRDFHERVMRYPDEFVVTCDAYSALRILGRDHPDIGALIRRAIDAGFLDYIERIPHRKMEVRVSLDWGCLRQSWPDLHALYETSILSRVPSALFLDTRSIYALTHVVMFFYDYGMNKEASIDQADIDGIRETLTMLMVVSCQEANWDILGEIMFCWDCIGLQRSALYERSWRVLLRTQTKDGAFPASGRETMLRPSDQVECCDFDFHYHTTIVVTMAVALHLDRAERSVAYRGEDGKARRNALLNVQWAGANKYRVFTKSREWLDEILKSVEAGKFQINHLCRIYLAGWIASQCTGEKYEEVSDAAEEIGKLLQEHAKSRDKGFPAVSPTLALLVSGVLLSQGVVIPFMSEFLAQAEQFLRSVAENGDEVDTALCEKRLVMHGFGLHPSPKLVDPARVEEMARALPLTASTEDVEALLSAVNSLTGFGTRHVELEDPGGLIRDVLCGLTTHHLRKYDLPMGCKLVRAAHYLGFGDEGPIKDCLSFIYLQQRPGGAFGLLGPEEAELRTAAPEVLPELDLCLPVTLACLWTLGEAEERRWRLFDSLPKVTLPSSHLDADV